MTFLLDGVDFSDCVQYRASSETMRKVYGDNGITTLDGTEIVDLIGVKYDLTVKIRPIKPERLTALAQKIANPYVTVTYFSGYRNSEVAVPMIPEMSDVVLGLMKLATDERFYIDSTLTFRQR